MSTMILFVIFTVGVVLTMWAGNIFVNSSSDIATKWGIPKFIIGATIVSVATTLPEVIVSALSASEGRVGMAVGNGIGSVIANLGLILAFAVIVKPIVIDKKLFDNKGYILIIGLVLLWFLTNTGELLLLGIVLLLALLVVFLVENIISAKSQIGLEFNEDVGKSDGGSNFKNIMFFIVGAVGISLGARVLVSSASEIAIRFGMQEQVIAKTMMAIGTSLPELVTAIVALKKSENAMVVGNILGANIIDTLLILPVCAMIFGGTLPVSLENTLIDIPVALILSMLFIIPTLFTKKLQRWQGLVALHIYITYIIQTVLFST